MKPCQMHAQADVFDIFILTVEICKSIFELLHVASYSDTCPIQTHVECVEQNNFDVILVMHLFTVSNMSDNQENTHKECYIVIRSGSNPDRNN